MLTKESVSNYPEMKYILSKFSECLFLLLQNRFSEQQIGNLPHNYLQKSSTVRRERERKRERAGMS